VLNDETLEALARQALCHAQAGADVVAPSDMMDGRIGAHPCRARCPAPDDPHAHPGLLGQVRVGLLRPVPRRGRLGGNLSGKGNKSTYQMDPANSDEALREVALDISPKAPTW
jgi:porphobilinogen synthase